MTRPQYDFGGKHVVVTGANRGIGRAIAEGFRAAGANLTIAALEDDVTAVAENLGANGVVCDIASTDDVAALAASVEQVDVLVNNAGFEYKTPVTAGDVMDQFRRVIEINVVGTFDVTRQLLTKIPDGGRIVNTASIWGKTAVADYSAYCASKHAIIGLTRSLSRELGPRNVAVNAVCPGWVKTDAAMRSLSHMAEAEQLTESALLEEIVAVQSFDGLMQPEDMVDIYLFLASDAARNITGQSYTIDRGELMQ